MAEVIRMASNTKLASILDEINNKLDKETKSNKTASLSDSDSLPNISSSIGVAIVKVANFLRNQTDTVTYADVRSYLEKKQ